MADYDNGLPPEGIDVSDKSVQAVNYEKKGINTFNSSAVSSVGIVKDAATEHTKTAIQSINLQKEPAGQNLMLFV